MNFNNYSDATTNGSQLGTVQIGANQSLSGGMTPPPMNNNTGLTNQGVTNTGTVLDGAGAGNAQQGAGGNFWSKDGGAGLILGGVQVLGNLWSTFQQHKMAKEQMSFAKEQWDTNLANQTQTYNTALEDRVTSRHAYSGKSQAETDAYMDKNRL